MIKTTHHPLYRTIIATLKKARVAAGLTQQDVAKKLGKPQSYISKVEIGERKLDLLETMDLAQIYRIPLDFFIADVSSSNKYKVHKEKRPSTRRKP
jgi:transcriptional regulator with XRE-family HTH domain